MKRNILAMIVIGLIFQLFSFAAHAEVKLTILHLNDFHGRIFPYMDKGVDSKRPSGGAAFLASMIAEHREANPDGTILVSAGDMFQGTPVSNIFHGKPVLDMMNRLKFDAMTIGNHEFDWGMEVFADLLSHARFPFVSANIKDDRGDCLKGVAPYILLERKGVKIGIIGLATPETAYTTKPDNVRGLTFLDPVETTPDRIREIREKGAQLVVLLTHLGLDGDKKLAAAVSGIDVIVGGHTHTAVTDPVTVGKTIIVQAGCNGLYLGVLDLYVDEKTGSIMSATKKGGLRQVSAGSENRFDREIKKLADSYNEAIKTEFSRVIGETTQDLTRGHDGDSILGNLVTDAMKAASGADLAIQNSGGIRTDIPAGKITMEQVYGVLPFDNEVITMDLTGADIIALFERAVNQRKGLLQVSGVGVLYRVSSSGAGTAEVTIKGQPIDRGGIYRVATNDFLSVGGDDFKEFLKGRNILHGGVLRDILMEYIKANSPVKAPKRGRIIVTPK